MPRTSRTVAQRLASQTKSRKRRGQRPGAPPPPAGKENLDEAAPQRLEPGEATEMVIRPRSGSSRSSRFAGATPTAKTDLGPSSSAPTASRTVATSAGIAPTVAKTAPTRRRYAEYGEEYRYIWGDLRRIVLVAGGLLLLLILLSFIIA